MSNPGNHPRFLPFSRCKLQHHDRSPLKYRPPPLPPCIFTTLSTLPRLSHWHEHRNLQSSVLWVSPPPTWHCTQSSWGVLETYTRPSHSPAWNLQSFPLHPEKVRRLHCGQQGRAQAAACPPTGPLHCPLSGHCARPQWLPLSFPNVPRRLQPHKLPTCFPAH